MRRKKENRFLQSNHPSIPISIQRMIWGMGILVWMGLLGPSLAHAQCPIAQQCGASCCPSQQLCYQGQCAPQGASCQQNSDCAAGSYCNPELQHCLVQVATNAQCTYRPPIGQFSPSPLWEWSTSTTLPTFNNVMMAPMVMALQDSNNDGKIDIKDMPSVVFMSYVSGGSFAEEGVVRALRGDTGQEIFTISNPSYRVNALGSLALGDIDNDGKPDIVAPRYAGKSVYNGGIYAFDNAGNFKWVSKFSNGQIAPLTVGWGGASLADLDGDGKVEVIVGNTIVRGSDGVVICQGVGGNGSPDYRPLSVVADLDGDGIQEIVTGSTAYRNNCSTMWTSGGADGYTAVADLDKDGKPEMIVISQGAVRVHNGQTGTLITSAAIPGGGGGPPTIADFNGDKNPDIASAGRDYYVIYAFDGGTKKLSLLWQFKTQDWSSAQTGSSVFDFEGDGKAEAVYNDELFMRVFNGNNGNVLYSTSNRSATTLEYPVIVDVNNDGRSEIVFSSNNGTMARLRVFRDTLDNWVDTRNIWNQHAYNVTNICTGPTDPFCPPGHRFGQIPAKPLANWKTTGLNNFRQNVQGSGLFEAADLILKDLRFSCDVTPNKLLAGVWLFNQGAKKIPAQLPITIYQGDPTGTKQKLATVLTTRDLDPGEGIFLTTSITPLTTLPNRAYAAADDDGTGKQTRNECDKTNNFNTATIPPRDKDICDGQDDDCDGKTDEDYPTKDQACEVGVGGCKEVGKYVCKADGTGVECSATGKAPTPEICDGIDNDCNGQIDENLTQGCTNACGSGFEICKNGTWENCSARQPTTEQCNNIDDDCDGQVDNNIPERACQTLCGSGQERCVAGQWAFCTAPQPIPEDCNGKDDDCDGQIDNGLTPRPCQGPCGNGTATCQGGKWGGCSGPAPQTETCNGKDDDCDGVIDNGLTRTCSSACGEGKETCRNGSWENCSAPKPSNEICDGKDNNCDGKVDNETNGQSLCPAGLVCNEGQCRQKCSNGECPAGLVCQNDVCVGDACKNINCDPDKRCVAGKCVDACALVTCPEGSHCITQGNKTHCLPDGQEPNFEPSNEIAPEGTQSESQGEINFDQGETLLSEQTLPDASNNDALEVSLENTQVADVMQKEDGNKQTGSGSDDVNQEGRLQSPGCSCQSDPSSDLGIFAMFLFVLLLVRRRPAL
ncbi:MAG: VCBS repeat-containing protein [Myxococcales bacterium]|nr:VCBS repeat-containing protein [Myxococcales bacterium]